MQELLEAYQAAYDRYVQTAGETEVATAESAA